MDLDREIDNVEDQLQSHSLEEIESCSSSILDREDMYVDDDDYDDGVNVTLLSSSVIMKSDTDSAKNTMVEKELNASATTINTIDSNDPKLPSIAAQGVDDKKLKRLNGAAKKRFRYLVDHGHSREEARVLAEKPYRVAQPEPSKRRRNADLSESTTSDTNPPKRLARQFERGQTSQVRSSVQSRLAQARKGGESLEPKEAAGNSGPQAPSYSEVVNYVRVGILPVGYPNTELTTQQLAAIQNEILKKVSEQRKERMKPKFGSCLFRPGHLIIVCKNKDTVEWLKAKISVIKPWENACLITVDEKDIPRPEILVGFFPRSEQDSNEEILTYVESQNEGLVVDAWRILKRYTVKQYHVELVFTVDAVSMRSLEDCKFTIDYKFGVAYIRKRNPKTESSEGDQTEGANDINEELPRSCVDQPKQVPGTSKSTTGVEMTGTVQMGTVVRPEGTDKGSQGSSRIVKEKSDIVMPSNSKQGADHLVYRQIKSHKQQFEARADKTACKSI
nr:uncharacterized protein LOC109403392 [Aedes albopictus]